MTRVAGTYLRMLPFSNSHHPQELVDVITGITDHSAKDHCVTKSIFGFLTKIHFPYDSSFQKSCRFGSEVICMLRSGSGFTADPEVKYVFFQLERRGTWRFKDLNDYVFYLLQ